MNEVVKYHNNMNLVNFSHFNEVEFNIFFAVCQQMRDKNLSEIELSFEKIRELTQYANRNLERLIKNIDSTYKKLLETNIRIETTSKIIRFVLFTKFEIDKNNKTVTIKTNEEFEYILNAITSNFTRFELEEFVSLSKTNSKTLYRMLKQYRKAGFWSIDYKEFLELIGISNWSRMDINREINRIVADVTPFFQNLEVKKIKKGGKQTGAIQRLEFTFKKEEIEFNELKIGKLKELERFLLATYPANTTIAKDKDGTVYYFDDEKYVKERTKNGDISTYYGNINNPKTAYYQALKKISKLTLQNPTPNR